MQKRLDNNYILMYWTHNEDKSVIAKRFVKKFKAKIYNELIASDRKSYLSCLNKLVDQYNNTYHNFMNRKPINADNFSLSRKIETNLRALSSKLMIESAFIEQIEHLHLR